MKKILFSLLCVVICFNQSNAEDWDTYSDTWVAYDALKREVASSDTGCKGVDSNSTVGMFYYLWHRLHEGFNKDITELLKANATNPDWDAEGRFHWGSKPWLGYYRLEDRFVVMKHMQMLKDAGVDFYFFDATNAFTYDGCVQTVMDEIDRREKYGMSVPKLCYMLHSNEADTADRLWEAFFSKPQYDKYWYWHRNAYNNQPLILADRNNVIKGRYGAQMGAKFVFRYSWAWIGAQNNQWSWLEYYPQGVGYTLAGSTRVPEQISVSVAQHAYSKVGKSYHSGYQPAVNNQGLCGDTPRGLYFQEQWDRAISVHPPVVMVTQFNEWAAQRFIVRNADELARTRPGVPQAYGESYFVDVYNAEFSRDLEPSTHPSVGDNYYYQLVSNVRKYRGCRQIPVPTISKTIILSQDWSQWDAETVEYRDDIGDTEYTSRDVQSPETFLRKTNDIVMSKVIKDRDYYYFYVKTREDLTDPKTSLYWMTLYLNTDLNYSTGWWGYNYRAVMTAEGVYVLQRALNGTWDWELVDELPLVRWEGNQLNLGIPRNLIDHTDNKDFDFKWVDNVPDVNQIMNFIQDGDVAPNGRFNYRFKGSRLASSVDANDIVYQPIEAKAVAKDGALTVSINGETEQTTIDIFNSKGSLVETRNTNSSEETFMLPNDIYLVRVSPIKGKSQVIKVII